MLRSAAHEDLVAYLVRRLLENGANTSFVNRLADDAHRSTRSCAIPVEAAESERERQVGATAAAAGDLLRQIA